MIHFTSGKISHDPEPWVNAAPDFERGSTADVEEWQPRHGVIHDPRPEFDNHNPILVEFRRSAPWDVARSARIAAEWLEPPARPIPASASDEQIAHARRVLTKLAALMAVSS